MKLHNTLSRQVEDIKPLSESEVTIYTCGPTVYDYPHIGNWFTFIRYDLLIRTLKTAGLQPKWVMNITDVGHLVSDADEGEDKLEKGARREGKSAWDVAKFYGDYFVDALKRLNFTTPDFLPKATEHIQEQIDMIKALEDKGYAYAIDDGVYYDTSKFEGYTSFARLDLDDLQEGARVAVNEQKRNPSDFALWKFSPQDHQRDMEWDSPWGKGFPGWHIECSAMSKKYLGDTIDIHAGGIDHVPVHHTNEIAQSEAANGVRFANHWMHANHILVGEEKISKSLGNGITLEDIEAKGYKLDVLRFLVLQSHYRTQSKFSWEEMQSAKNGLDHIRGGFNFVQWTKPKDKPVENLAAFFNGYVEKIKSHLENDLDTPQVIALLHEAAKIFGGMPASQLDLETVKKFDAYIQDVLGFSILSSIEITEEIKGMIAERETARSNKDWAKADELRKKLLERGIAIRDSE